MVGLLICRLLQQRPDDSNDGNEHFSTGACRRALTGVELHQRGRTMVSAHLENALHACGVPDEDNVPEADAVVHHRRRRLQPPPHDVPRRAQEQRHHRPQRPVDPCENALPCPR